MNTVRRVGTVLATVLLLSAAGTTAAPAVPAGSVRLSVDGVVWAETLAAPLFDPDVLWVPGDRRTAAFYVRNDGPTAADLRIGVAGTAGDLVARGAVSLVARIDGGTWRPVPVGAPSGALGETSVRPGGRSHLEIRARFAPSARNATQASGAALRFAVRLGEVLVDPVAGTSGELPATGAAPLGLPLLLGAALLGCGFGLVRRRREADDG